MGIKIKSFKETDDGRYLIDLKGIIRFQIKKEIETNKKYREFDVSFDNYLHDLSDEKEELKFSDLEIIFKDLKNLFEKRGFIINWKALEKQSLARMLGDVYAQSEMYTDYTGEEVGAEMRVGSPYSDIGYWHIDIFGYWDVEIAIWLLRYGMLRPRHWDIDMFRYIAWDRDWDRDIWILRLRSRYVDIAEMLRFLDIEIQILRYWDI